MIKKINLKEQVNALNQLFEYKRVGSLNNHMLNVLQAQCLLIEIDGTLNKENTGGTYLDWFFYKWNYKLIIKANLKA